MSGQLVESRREHHPVLVVLAVLVAVVEMNVLAELAWEVVEHESTAQWRSNRIAVSEEPAQVEPFETALDDSTRMAWYEQSL